MSILSNAARLAVGAFAVFSVATAAAHAGDRPAAAICDVLPDRLQALDARIAANASQHVYPGAVYLLSRQGKLVHSKAVGLGNVADGQPMRQDAIFRLASMSKPITAAAIMILVDQGKLRLNDPVGKYIPEFARMRVGPYTTSESDADLAKLPDALHPITVWNLLTHTAGLETLEVDKDLTTKLPERTTLAAWMAYYAHFPLAWQPGSKFAYSPLIGFDVLGRIVEVVSGQPYDLFLKTHILDPLGMKNTGFRLTPEQRRRLVEIYRAENGMLTPDIASFASDTYFSGAGGLYGTGPDYMRFAEMLAGHGSRGKVRILSRSSADLMGSLQLRPEFPGLGSGMGWGLGMMHVVSGTVPVGSYGWSGAFGTHFWIDPQNDLAAVFMINLSNAQGAAAPTSREYERLIDAALSANCVKAQDGSP